MRLFWGTVCVTRAAASVSTSYAGGELDENKTSGVNVNVGDPPAVKPGVTAEIKVHRESDLVEMREEVLQAELEYVKMSDFHQPVPLLPLPVGRPTSTYFEVPPLARDEVHAGIKALLEAQLATDALNPDSAPLAMYDGEILPGNSRVSLRNPISLSKYVLVYEVVDHADSVDGSAVIKYQSNCEFPEDSYNVILRDYWFQHILAGADICPKVYYVSPPAKFPEFKTPKLNFSLDEAQWKICSDHHRSHVRYMVMEKIPTTVWGLMFRRGLSQRFRFRQGLQLIIDLIPKLKRMHSEPSMSIVHGDLHPGNIVRLRDSSFGLLDFGMAFFRDEYGPDDEIWRIPKSYIHCYFSHYNIMGYRFGPRDDVFKALLSAAFLMTGSELFDDCMKFQSNPNGMYLFHRNANYFNFKGTLISQVADGNAEIEEAIAKHLEMALVLARSVDGVDDLPNYDEISRHASAVRDIRDYAGGGMPVPPALLSVPEVQLPIVTSVVLARAQEVFSAFSESTSTPVCPALTAAVSVKFMQRGEAQIEFEKNQLTCTNSDFARMVHSNFDHRVMNLLEEEGVAERLTPVGLGDNCNHKLVFRTTWGGFNDENKPKVDLARIFASSVFSVLKTVHSLGLVLGSELSFQHMTLDLETKTQFRLRQVPPSLRMYVDPWTGRHAAPCASWEALVECPTRRTDFQRVAKLFAMIRPLDSFKPLVEEFALYANGLGVAEEPNYDDWRRRFEAIDALAVASVNP